MLPPCRQLAPQLQSRKWSCPPGLFTANSLGEQLCSLQILALPHLLLKLVMRRSGCTSLAIGVLFASGEIHALSSTTEAACTMHT